MFTNRTIIFLIQQKKQFKFFSTYIRTKHILMRKLNMYIIDNQQKCISTSSGRL